MVDRWLRRLPIRWLTILSILSSLGVLLLGAGLLAYLAVRGLLWMPGLINMDWQLMRVSGAYHNRLISDLGRNEARNFIHRPVELGSDWRHRAADISGGIYSVQLLDRDGHVIDRYPVDSQLPQISPERLLQFSPHHPRRITFQDGPRQVLVAPIRYAGSEVGYVVMSSSADFRQHLLNSFMRNSGLVGLLILLGTLLVHLMLVSVLIRPLQRLSESARQVMDGDLSVRTGLPPGRNEVFQVGAVFDQMVGRLHQLFSTQQAFVADVSHELRTPLTALNGQLHILQTLSQDQPPDARRERALNRSQHEIDRMTGLVEDLLALVRAESPQFSPLSVSALVAEALETTAAVFPDRTIQVGDIPEITMQGHSAALVRALTNLLENACNYTPADKEIRLDARIQGDRLEISVTDQGCGMNAETLAQLGRRFYRPDPSRSRQTGGSGLGVSIAQATAERHHGSLRFDSQPGRGTRACLLLPLG